jgi:uncharacterized membrane protein YbhN (UPF0104 family)
MTARQIGLLAIKLLVTVGLLWLLASKIDLRALAQQFQSIQVSWAVVSLALLFGQLLLTAIRWYVVGLVVSATLGLGQAIRLVLVGQFFSQVLPTSVGGDAVRAWMLARETAQMGRAVISIVCDRVAALVVLTVVVALSMPLLSVAGLHEPFVANLAIGLPALATCGVLVLLLFGERVSEILQENRLLRPAGVLIGNLHIVLFTSVKSMQILGLALLVQLIMLLAVLVCAMALGIKLGAVHALLIPSILLVSMLPISFAGWGVRESAMVVGLGFAGVSAPEALAISLLVGLAQIVIGIPGGALWLIRRRGAAPA